MYAFYEFCSLILGILYIGLGFLGDIAFAQGFICFELNTGISHKRLVPSPSMGEGEGEGEGEKPMHPVFSYTQ
jgi:hypothetical protein